MSKESFECKKQKPDHKTLKIHCTSNTEGSGLNVNMTIKNI